MEIKYEKNGYCSIISSLCDFPFLSLYLPTIILISYKENNNIQHFYPTLENLPLLFEYKLCGVTK